MLQCMTRVDLPIVVVQLMVGERREYRGRLATMEAFKEYQRNCGFPAADITYEVWPVSVVTGSTEGTRLMEHEVAERFADAVLGQRITVKAGPFKGEHFTLVGLLRNKFDKFFFVTPAPRT